MINLTHLQHFFFLHFRISIGLGFYWSRTLGVLIEIKRKNALKTLQNVHNMT